MFSIVCLVCPSPRVRSMWRVPQYALGRVLDRESAERTLLSDSPAEQDLQRSQATLFEYFEVFEVDVQIFVE